MKYIRPAFLAILLCFVAGAAFAQDPDIKVFFDPPTVPVFQDPNTNFNPITSPTAGISFGWGSCADDPYAPADISGDEACANFANLTGQALTQMTFTFVAADPMQIPGANTVSCVSLDPNLSDASCPGGTFTPGQLVTVTFSGGISIPPSPSKTDLSVFFLAENGVDPTQINDLQWTASVTEPSSITLLAAGMGLIGICMVFVKR